MEKTVWRFESYLSETDPDGHKVIVLLKYDDKNKVLQIEYFQNWHAYCNNAITYQCAIYDVTKEILLAFAKGHYIHENIEKTEKGTDVLFMHQIDELGLSIEAQFRWHDWPKHGLCHDEWCSDKDAQIEHAKTNNFVRYSYHLDDPHEYTFRWNKRSYNRFRKLMQEWASRI